MMFGRADPLALVRKRTPVHLQSPLDELLEPLSRSEDVGVRTSIELVAVRWLMGLGRVGAVPLRPHEYEKLKQAEQRANFLQSSKAEALADEIIKTSFPSWRPADVHPDRDEALERGERLTVADALQIYEDQMDGLREAERRVDLDPCTVGLIGIAVAVWCESRLGELGFSPAELEFLREEALDLAIGAADLWARLPDPYGFARPRSRLARRVLRHHDDTAANFTREWIAALPPDEVRCMSPSLLNQIMADASARCMKAMTDADTALKSRNES
jgi:hypothetical protein